MSSSLRECKGQEGVVGVYQVDILLATLSFWNWNMNFSSRVSCISNSDCDISRVGELPGNYLDGEDSM